MSYFDDISIYDDDDDELETQPVTQVEPVEPAPSSGYYANYMEAYGDDNKEGSFTKALGAGLVDDTKSTYYAVKSLFTDDELDRQRAIQISDRSPAGESFVDAYNEGDAGKAWSATKNAVGRGLGNIAPMIAGGGVGGMAAKGAGMSVKAGVTAGAMASSAPQNMGEAIRSIDDKGAAIAAGTVNTMLDALPVMGVVNKLGLGKKVTGEVTDSVIKKFGKAGLEGMAKEGATEALQEFVIDATKYSIGESKELMSDDNIKKWIDSGVGGALVGGAITSSASVLGGQGSTAANPDTDISQAPEGSYASALEMITPEPTFDPTSQAESVTNETNPAPVAVESMGDPTQAMINDKGANRPMSDVISELTLTDPKEAMAKADELQKGLPIDDKRALYEAAVKSVPIGKDVLSPEVDPLPNGGDIVSEGEVGGGNAIQEPAPGLSPMSEELGAGDVVDTDASIPVTNQPPAPVVVDSLAPESGGVELDAVNVNDVSPLNYSDAFQNIDPALEVGDYAQPMAAEKSIDNVELAPLIDGNKNITSGFSPKTLQSMRNDGANPSEVNGVIRNGKLEFNPDRIKTESDLRKLVAHEANHIGMSGILGGKLNQTLDRISKSKDHTVKAHMRSVARQYSKQIEGLSGMEAKRLIASETMATLAESGFKAGPMKAAYIRVKRLVKDATGIDYSESELQSLVADSQKHADKSGSLEIKTPSSQQYSMDLNDQERLSRDLDRKDSPLKRLWRREFTKEGLLPNKVFTRKVESDSAKNLGESKISQFSKDYDNAIRSEYDIKPGQKIPPDIQDKVRDYITGTDADLPKTLKVKIDGMRDYLDDLSDKMINLERDLSGDISNDKIKKIQANKGSYLNRSYEAFDNPKYADKARADTDLMERSEAYILKKNPKLSSAEVTGEINKILDGAADKGGSAFGGSGKLGSKDSSFLKKRKKIPKEIRELLGEYLDPKINFIRSATNMENHIANHVFLMNVKKDGMGTFLFDKPTGQYSVKIAGDNSDTMNPLNGLYTSPDIKQGFIDTQDQGQMGELMRQIIRVNSFVKYGKTILAPTTQARNFYSASMFTVANGHVNWRHMGKSWGSMRSDIFTKEEKYRSYLNDLIKDGVLHDNPYSGELRDHLKDMAIESKDRGKVGRGVKKTTDFLQKTYQAGDDFWKIIGYENELASKLKAGIPLKEAKKIAAHRIRNGYPTYSMVPKAMRGLRRFPLAGTFVSFPWEIMRTTFNQVGFIREDMKIDKPAAYRRIAGLAVAGSLSAAASKLSMMALGLDDEDDESIRANLMAPWDKNSEIIYFKGDGEGNFGTMSLSFMDPYTYLKEPLLAIANGENEGVDDKLLDAAKGFISPYVGADIAAGSIGEIIFNTKLRGGSVYNPDDTSFNIAKSVSSHFGNAVSPSFIKNISNIKKAVAGESSRSGKVYSKKDEALALAGFRTSTVNIQQSMMYKGYGFSESKRNAATLLSRKLGTAENITDKEIKTAFNNMNRARDEAFKKELKLIKTVRKLGMSDEKIKETIIDGGVGKADAAALMAGITPKWKMSSSFIKSAVLRVGASATNQERKKELAIAFNHRRDYVSKLVSELGN